MSGGDRWVQDFDAPGETGRDRLGGKGAALAGMTRLGLPVPPGFTITTEACRAYLAAGGEMPPGLADEVERHLAGLEARLGRRFGDPADPLLISVRSGAPVSMPGMMDTVLNIGLGDRAVEGLAASTGDRRFALDAYRRLLQMFGGVVLHVPAGEFDDLMVREMRRSGAAADADMGADDLRRVIAGFEELLAVRTGRGFPRDPRAQLDLAIRAVFESWRGDRAVVYRRLRHIPEDMGTAVNIQAMVFGNRGPRSGTGVVFSRDPSTGERGLVGEYLAGAQGEDVVAGIRTPEPVSALEAALPQVYAELVRTAEVLEAHYGDMQDIEFTVEEGRLYLLQTRAAQRTARAALRVARDLVAEGSLTRSDAVLRIAPSDLSRLLHPGFSADEPRSLLGRGLGASPGAAVGEVCFEAEEAERLAHLGREVILVRPETAPDDIRGIAAAQGVLTARGGLTCHAAIVTRGMGRPCVVGCEGLQVDPAARVASLGGQVLHAGDWISVDGGTGEVFAGRLPRADQRPPDEFGEVLRWADAFRGLGVRANADTPEDAARARALGAEGVGLVRTEHMFMAPDRLPVVQAMIVAADPAERREYLQRLLPMQEGDFVGILRAMEGRPVTIRLLDPPLHEFLPRRAELEAEVTRLRAAAAAGGGGAVGAGRGGAGGAVGSGAAGGGGAAGAEATGAEATGEGAAEALRRAEGLLRRATALAEVNPMLGHRGVRVGITHPEIYEMQVRAILQGAARLRREGLEARPEIMFPLVGHAGEMARMRALAERVAAEVGSGGGPAPRMALGACIEVPRGCLVAGDIATEAEFFSFGTNDLTQMCFGFSRDDAEAKFLHSYLQQGILTANPFETLDADGVGRLIEMAVRLGRQARPDLKVGLCGEQGGDPASIALCDRLGLDYVSVSPPRVPVARLAAAHAALRREEGSPGQPTG